MKLKVWLDPDGYKWVYRDVDGDVNVSHAPPEWSEEYGCYERPDSAWDDLSSCHWKCDLPYGKDSLHRILPNGKLKKCKN